MTAGHGTRVWLRTGRRCAAILPYTLLAAPANAQDGSVCPDTRVHVQGSLDARWLEPVVRLCEHFASIRDLDPSANLVIVPAGSDVVAQATLGDGRVAVRRIRSPDELSMTVEALVVLPPRSEPKAAPPPEPAPLVTGEPATDVKPPVATGRALGVEIGLAAMGRLSRPPTYLSAGIGAHAGVRPGNWILGLTARFEPVQALTDPNPPEFEMSSVGAGFFVARDFVHRRHVGLDCGVSASLVSDTQSTQGGADEIGGSQTDVRLGMLVRARLGGPTWRFAPSAELEVSPSRLRRDARIDDTLPTLPSWSLALGLGMTFEEP